MKCFVSESWSSHFWDIFCSWEETDYHEWSIPINSNLTDSYPASIYLYKVNIGSTTKMREIYSELTIKITLFNFERFYTLFCFIIDCEQVNAGWIGTSFECFHQTYPLIIQKAEISVIQKFIIQITKPTFNFCNYICNFCNRRRSGVTDIVNFEQISDIVLVFLLLTLNK